ncbi:MAG: tetratricopeptide repeat protein, partial [bacterium]|nr:tetratricopeptide repeat protein [bacterium]
MRPIHRPASSSSRRQILVGLRLAAPLALLTVLAGLALVSCSGRSKADKLHEEGVLFFKAKKYYQAIDKFEEALKLQRERPATLYMAADAYLQTGKPEMAVRYGEEALQKQPDNENLEMVVGQAHLNLAVRDSLTTGSAGVPDAAELGKAQVIASGLRKKNPDSLDGMLLQARIDALSDRLAESERQYRAIIAKDTRHVPARVGLIDVLLHEQKLTEAEKLSRELLALKDVPPMAVDNLATVLTMERRFDEAYRILEPYLTAGNKETVLSHFLLAGDVLMAQIDAQLKPTGRSALEASTDTVMPAPEGVAIASPAPQPPAEILKTVTGRLDELSQTMENMFPARPETWFYRAVALQLQGKADEAVRHFEQAIQHAPNDYRYRLALAGGLMKAGRYASARQELRTVLKAQPGDYDTRLRLAQCLAAEGSFEEALELLRTLDLEKKTQRVEDALGRTLIMSEDPDKVEEGLALLTSLHGEKALMPGGREFVRAVARFNAARAAQAQGKTADAVRQYGEAEELFRQTIDKQPGNFVAEMRLGDLSLVRGDLLEAFMHVNRAAALNMNYAPAKARMYARLGQYKAAIDLYRELLAKNPKSVGFRVAIADLEIERGQIDEGIRLLKELTGEFPDQPLLVIDLAQAHARKGNLKAGIDLLVGAAARFADDPSIRLALTRLLVQSGQADEARRQMLDNARILEDRLARLTAQGKTDQLPAMKQGMLAPLYMDLALADLLSGRDKEVAAHAARGVEADPSMALQAAVLEGIADIRMGQAAQAKAALDRAMSRKAQFQAPATLPFIMSMIDLAAGDKAAAAKVIAGQRGLNPESVRLYQRMIERIPADQLTAATPGILLELFLTGNAAYANLALAQADAVLKQLPAEPFILARKAEASMALGRHDQALAVYDEMAKAWPAFTPVEMARVEVHLAMAGQA